MIHLLETGLDKKGQRQRGGDLAIVVKNLIYSQVIVASRTMRLAALSCLTMCTFLRIVKPLAEVRSVQERGSNERSNVRR